ncbi:MAG: alpha/beta fold hydrolase [Alphaproteobacteria bacterium]|nr:alpha/beta fold hydrolase [Alphaproteobacteria bacterium]
MVQPFTVDVPQAKLDAIRARVSAYPWFPAPEDESDQWSRGVNTAYLKELCAYWLSGYDWRTAEAELNRFPQYIATIDGLDVHFVHVVGEAEGTRPLILSHGWPGSHYEFWGSIEKLAFPSRFGGSRTDAFDVICPSLPGYGFSAKPRKPLGQRATARLFDALMTKELGYARYLAQGGDWGSMVSSFLALDHPACVGVHLNMAALRPADTTPQTEEETQWLQTMQMMLQLEGAYLQEQSTKPQTLAMALMDSPVGTAAWILEKFHGWSDLRNGGLEGVYSKDQLLTNIMIYLVTDSIATSVWYYRARLEEGGFFLPAGTRVETPTGVANFKGEPVFKIPPRSWVERIYNLKHWSAFEEGGHFAAMEKPDAFVGDVRAFARAVGF